MPSSHDLIIQKRVALLNAPLKLNFKELFANLGKSVVSGSMGDFKGAAEYGIDALKELGLQDSPENVAWALISQSLTQALMALVDDYRDLLSTELDDTALEDLAGRVEHTLNAVEVSLDASFFERPQDLPLLEDFKSALVFWLQELGMDEHQADAFHYRLKGQFVLALHEQWGKQPESYSCIAQQMNTPFTKATLDQRAWTNYNLWLQEQPNARVFGEAFGLNQVYIPLRAYYKEKPCNDREKEEIKQIVCDLHAAIHDWVKQFDKNNALRVVSGGPGCGKSSFTKVLAAELAERNEIPVLFIPLHHFNLTEDLIQAVGNFIRDDKYLRSNPLEKDSRQERLLLIFDGLDELSMQGKAASDVAQQFVDEVIRTLERHNDNGRKWQVLITGRDLSVQANESRLRKPHQILHVLPYRLTDNEKKQYQDEARLLDIDQRSLWWEKFGKAKGKPYQSIPDELATEHLHPITREPLLNYLLSLSYERQEIQFNDETSLNKIYYDLLQAVHERQYAGHRHEASKDLQFYDFMEILEEIALAVWHGNGRTASESYLVKRCEESHLTRHLEKFSEGAKKGVVRLLTAFYFRQFGTESNGDRTFEFTHKSFGEYLTARRIISAVDNISDEVSRYEKSPRKGWDYQKALVEWIKITGATAIDDYLFRFIKDEIANRGIDIARQWQKTFSTLLGIVVRDGSPVEQMSLSSFLVMLQQSRNSEEALLAIYYSCSILTKETIKIDWGNYSAFGGWLKRTQGQRIGPENILIFEMLQNLDFSYQCLDIADLYKANLRYSDFSSAQLNVAVLMLADLRDVNAKSVSFSNANLTGANFTGSNLEKTRFIEASLENVNMKGVNLCGTKFFSAKLKKANLEQANLEKADLEEADLVEAALEGANLKGANLKGANLEGANLEGANLEGANLEGANLEGANLEGANLEGANLEGANLEGANLEGANLEGANLEGANLEGANLKGTILERKIPKT